MATPRKNWSRLPDQILREAWSDSTLADFIRLQAYLNQRWARDCLTPREAGEAVLSAQEMMLVTHTVSPRSARRRLLALPRCTPLGTFQAEEVQTGRALGVRITWSKFAEFQCYPDRNPPDRGQSSGDSGVEIDPSETRRNKTRQEEEAGADAPSMSSLRLDTPPSEDASKLTALLGQTILKSVPKAKLPRSALEYANWAPEIDRLHRLDACSWEEIRAVIEWLPTHSGANGFCWGRQILSARKLREKFAQLHSTMLASTAAPADSDRSRRQAEEVFRGA